MRKIAILVLIMILFGCDDNGRIGPTRMASEIRGHTNDIDTAWFAYYLDTGDKITQEGLRMDRRAESCFYFKNNGLGGLDVVNVPYDWQPIISTNITGNDGDMEAVGHRVIVGETHTLRTGVLWQRPNADNYTCSAEMQYNTSAAGVQWAGVQTCSSMPKWVALASEYNLTEEELEAITNAGYPIPSRGIMAEPPRLVQQCGSVVAGGRYSKTVNFIIPVNLDNTEDYIRHSAPFMYSSIIATASPKDLSGKSFTVKVKTDTNPEGIEVMAREIAVNDAQTVHVLRTDMFLPVEPGILGDPEISSIPVYDRWAPLDDPNDVGRVDTSDPNLMDEGNYFPERMMEVKVIELGVEGDYIDIEPVVEGDLLIESISAWLTDDRTFDVTGDGVVNFVDYLNWQHPLMNCY